ncbi:outer dynein arm-docking complex subunit 4 [Planococcus citri]|uniref:outer dynein arm-docking complex subunit 4 n=1 Tax=Planococcus citri TaxID=170843 RepID=UPI0031F92EBA
MMSGDIAESSSSITSSINKQAKDILRVTGQNEVIQSFVRNDVGLESEEGVNRDPAKNALSKEKKGVGVAWRSNELISPNGSAEKKRDHKEEPAAKSNSATPMYQQLGRDAQVPDQKGSNRKNANKWNRRQRLLEEVYTDKDRAAAVNLGSRDIKQSLKLKRRQDRTRILEISEEAHPGTLLALAIHRFKTGDVYVAMKFVDKALELNPYDKNALVARSKCHLMMGNASLALKDAEQALTEDKSFIKGLYQKAEALYHLAQFEYSLMYFHRGLHIRPQMENFRLGVHKAQQAILNTIGKSVPSFEKFLTQRSQFNPEQTYQSQESFSHKLDLPSTTQSNVNLQRDKKLLKELHADKIYLEKLMRNPDLACLSGKYKPDNKILAEAKEGMEFLQNRQYFWKQQQALVTVKAAGSASSKLAKNRTSSSAKPLKNGSRS